MKTNTLLKALMIMAFMSFTMPSFSAVAAPVVGSESPEARVSELTQRLEEIKGMDHKTLTRAEKKALRVEVRSIKKEMAALSGGVYLSIGAILLVILLLILLV